MTDLIDRLAFMKAMYHRAFETDGDTMWQSGCWIRYKAIEQVVKEQPSIDAVEVVRCKDCIYHESGTEELDAWCNVWGNTTICDGYCFYGERKNDG